MSKFSYDRSSVLIKNKFDEDYASPDFRTTIGQLIDEKKLSLSVEINEKSKFETVFANLTARILNNSSTSSNDSPDKKRNCVKFTLPTGIQLVSNFDQKNPTAHWEFDRNFDGVVGQTGKELIHSDLLEGDQFAVFWAQLEDVCDLAVEQFKITFGSYFPDYKFKIIKPAREIKFKLSQVKNASSAWNENVIKSFNEFQNGNLVTSVKCFWTKVVPENKTFIIGITFQLEREFLEFEKVREKKRKLSESEIVEKLSNKKFSDQSTQDDLPEE